MRRGIAVCLVLAVLGAAQAEEELLFDKLATRARLFLDTMRYEKALKVFERATVLEPERAGEIALDWAWTHAKLGRFARHDKDYAAAAKHFTAAAQLDKTVRKIIAKECTYCRMKVLDKRFFEVKKNTTGADWQPLIDELEVTLEIMPACKWARARLGDAYWNAGKNDLAAREYLKVAGQRRRGNRKLKTLSRAAWKQVKKEKWSFGELLHPMQRKIAPGEFEVFYWGPFNIHHHNQELAERVGRALLYHYKQPLLDGFLPGEEFGDIRCAVYLCVNEEEMKSPLGPKVSRASAGNWKGMNIRCRHKDAGLFESILPHELAHHRARTKYKRFDNLPTYMDEGVASAAEIGRERLKNARHLAEVRSEGKLIPTRKLLRGWRNPGDPVMSNLFYAESQALVESLVAAHGGEKLAELFAETDTDFEKAFTDVYGDDWERFDAMIDEWIDRHAGLNQGSAE